MGCQIKSLYCLTFSGLVSLALLQCVLKIVFVSPYYFYLYICLGVFFFFTRLLLVFSFRSFLFAGLLRGPELQQSPSGAVASWSLSCVSARDRRNRAKQKRTENRPDQNPGPRCCGQASVLSVQLFFKMLGVAVVWLDHKTNTLQMQKKRFLSHWNRFHFNLQTLVRLWLEPQKKLVFVRELQRIMGFMVTQYEA